MTVEELVAVGRRLQRPTATLTSDPSGEPVGFWYGSDDAAAADDDEGWAGDEAEVAAYGAGRVGHHCWLTIDGRRLPAEWAVDAWLSVYTDDERCQGGRVELTPVIPKRVGLPLFAVDRSVLPPIDAVFLRGGPAVEQWLDSLGWKPSWGYNRNFRGREVVRAYDAVWHREYPLYLKDIYATIGGWHFPWPDDDWLERIDRTLLLQTFTESEPWVEVWRDPAGGYEVVQRIT